MSPAIWLTILALFLLGATLVYCTRRGAYPHPLRQRPSPTAAWTALPVPETAISELLSHVGKAFSLSSRATAKLWPNDTVGDIYRMVHPRHDPVDPMEMETLLRALDRAFGKSGLKPTADTALGELARRVAESRGLLPPAHPPE
jgi:hypothetical protein